MSDAEWNARHLADQEYKHKQALRAWEPTWEKSGIRVGFESPTCTTSPSHGRTAPSLVETLPASDAPGVGDLCALRGELIPTSNNQHLRRVVSVEPSAGNPNMNSVTFGPPLDRKDWPDMMRRMTAPTAKSAHVEGTRVTVVDAKGETVTSFDGGSDPHMWGGYVSDVMAQAAQMGWMDGIDGQERPFKVRRNQPSDRAGGRLWMLVDDQGIVLATDERSLLSRRPPERISALLMATKSAYADGWHESSLEPKDEAENDPEPTAGLAP